MAAAAEGHKCLDNEEPEREKVAGAAPQPPNPSQLPKPHQFIDQANGKQRNPETDEVSCDVLLSTQSQETPGRLPMYLSIRNYQLAIDAKEEKKFSLYIYVSRPNKISSFVHLFSIKTQTKVNEGDFVLF